VYLAESIWQVSGSLTLATYARLGTLERHEAARLTTRVMRHTVVLLLGLCAALFLLADLIEDVLFSSHDEMSTALRLLLPGVLLYGLAQSFSGFYTYQRGLPWVAAVVAGTGLAVDLLFAFLLVPPFGVPGAAAASSIAYGTAILLALAVFVRQERLNAADIFRFGRAEFEDYRTLARRARSVLGG
jgi:O-antigen/teichoic acid export membrane protein